MTDEQNKLAEIRSDVSNALTHTTSFKYRAKIALGLMPSVTYLLDLVVAKDKQFKEHTDHVQQFMNDLWALSIDPLHEGMEGLRVAEVCAKLREAARENREMIAAKKDEILNLKLTNKDMLQMYEQEKERADTEHLNNGTLAHQYNAAVEKIKELEAERDSIGKFNEDLQDNITSLEAHVASLREALERLCNAVEGGVYRPKQEDWNFAEAALQSTKGVE